MIKINIIGSIFGTTGYDSHTRSLINALYKVADCRLSTQLPQNWMSLVNDAELDMIQKQRDKDDYNLIISMPNTWKLYTGIGKNIGYCVWEGDKVPESWIEEFLNPRIDFIFVPSEHTKKAILNTWKVLYDDTAILDKIRVIPHGVDRSIFHSLESKDVKSFKDGEKEQSIKQSSSPRSFKFICNKGWRGTSWDRGGVQYVIKAFCEEFNKDEKTELILKLNPAYINPQQIQQAMQQLNIGEDHPKISINCENIPFDKLPLLYNQADCYVCATRAESFNLPGLEAMSCGLPTIQTDFGGQIDYMTYENSLIIDYELEEVKNDLMYEGISWATPDMKDLKEQLRWAFNNQNKMKEMGKQAEEDSKNWTWDKTSEKIISIL